MISIFKGHEHETQPQPLAGIHDIDRLRIVARTFDATAERIRKREEARMIAENQARMAATARARAESAARNKAERIARMTGRQAS